MMNDGVRYSLKRCGEVVAKIGLMRVPNRANYLLWVGRGIEEVQIGWIEPYKAVILSRTLEAFMEHSCSYIDRTKEEE